MGFNKIAAKPFTFAAIKFCVLKGHNFLLPFNSATFVFMIQNSKSTSILKPSVLSEDRNRKQQAYPFKPLSQ